MAEIEISLQTQKNIELDMGEKANHSQLKNLGFEESGHRGFQKELTKEQLELIEAVKDKEDIANKTKILSPESTHNQYPTAKTVYDAMNEWGDFELIEKVTLTEDVVTISPTINGQYKEIYWVFDIPPMSEIDTTDKGRLYLFPVANKTTTNGAKLIQQGNIIISNTANEWKLMIRSEVCGKYARTELWYDDNAVIISGSYGRTPDTNNQRGIVSPYTLVTNPYIDGLTLIMTSSNGGRVFPAGTKYELWGVKA